MKTRLLATTAAAALAALALATPASAQFQKPEDAIKYRQSALFIMGTHFARIGAMVQGKAPYDPKAALENAQVVEAMVHLPWIGFGPGYEKGAPTKARPEIWGEQEKFREHQEKLFPAVEKLTGAAKTNNLDNLKAAFGNAAQACKACHDQYRNK